jgi:hypothetical protein
MSKPNRAWAYDIIRRWEKGDRRNLTAKNYETACDAVKVDREDAAKRVAEIGEHVDTESGEVTKC